MYMYMYIYAFLSNVFSEICSRKEWWTVFVMTDDISIAKEIFRGPTNLSTFDILWIQVIQGAMFSIPKNWSW